ncbi:MAG: hypothetical protein ACTSXO_10350 [Candidatus Heimdallarchaeota archaeon]|nr:MAG: hypothetical protein DRP02_08255 [Candidatus Gerdarchaeota archaeon]
MVETGENNTPGKTAVNTREMLENDVRSNLRYCWQRAMVFAIQYKPTIQEVLDELVKGFLVFIPKYHPKREAFRQALVEVFHEMLGKFFSTEDISGEMLENHFIEKAIDKIKQLL